LSPDIEKEEVYPGVFGDTVFMQGHGSTGTGENHGAFSGEPAYLR
jgi:hypothetical protein